MLPQMCHFAILIIDVIGPQYLSFFACVHWPQKMLKQVFVVQKGDLLENWPIWSTGKLMV